MLAVIERLFNFCDTVNENFQYFELMNNNLLISGSGSFKMASEAAKVAQRCEEAKGSHCLDLCHCDLRKFPDAIIFLMKGTELQSVLLANNQLKSIPDKLCTKFTTITSI